MKKRLIAVILISVTILLSGCGQEAYENAVIAVDEYNAAVEKYNIGVDEYNDSIDEIVQVNTPFDEVIAFAEELLNSESIPFDESTKVTLTQALETARNLRIEPPEKMQHIELMTVSDKAKRGELDAIKADAETGRNNVISLPIPQKLSLPEYGSAITTLNDAIAAYSNSVESMNQITAPSDDFVIERLREIDTIVDIAPVTEGHDPNGNLGKQGGYIGCIYFSDSRIDKSVLYIAPGEDNVIDIGTDGGGAIEIYDSSEFAKRRDEYLASFDGTGFTSGSHYVYGTLVIRTSNEFTGSQQRELTDQIVIALTRVKEEESQEAEPGASETELAPPLEVPSDVSDYGIFIGQDYSTLGLSQTQINFDSYTLDLWTGALFEYTGEIYLYHLGWDEKTIVTIGFRLDDDQYLSGDKFTDVYNRLEEKYGNGQKNHVQTSYGFVDEGVFVVGDGVTAKLTRGSLTFGMSEDARKEFEKDKPITPTEPKPTEPPKVPPAIGMTEDEVLASTWGAPNDINKTTTAYGTSEQWVYHRYSGDYRYVYFENGIVTAIQE